MRGELIFFEEGIIQMHKFLQFLQFFCTSVLKCSACLITKMTKESYVVSCKTHNGGMRDYTRRCGMRDDWGEKNGEE